MINLVDDLTLVQLYKDCNFFDHFIVRQKFSIAFR
jgi:hypothetical protein